MADDAIQISEIVQRVKCEIHEAIPKPTGPFPTGPYQWLRDWSAKVDLTLVTTDQGSLNPGVSFIRPLRPETVANVGTVSRMFTLGIGGGLATTASRTETLSFTLSFAELRNPNYLAKCAEPEGLGLLGHLGLKEWMTSAIDPVNAMYLGQGYHAPPGGKSGGGKSGSKELKAIEGEIVIDPIDRKIGQLREAARQATEDAKEAKVAAAMAQALASRAPGDDLMESPQVLAGDIQGAYDNRLAANMHAGSVDDRVTDAKKLETELKAMAGALPPGDERLPRISAAIAAADKDLVTAKAVASAARPPTPRSRSCRRTRPSTPSGIRSVLS